MHEHKFLPSAEFKDYEYCIGCGSYHSTAQVDPRIIYEENPYWDSGDGKTGRSTLEQQCENFICIDDCGISKADRILQFVPQTGTILEIGAAPGQLLKMLTERGLTTFGIEPSLNYIPFILSKAPKAKVLHGYFPTVTKGFADNYFNCIIGCDVMEHLEDFDSYFKEGHRLLKEGGVMITMSPIILHDGLHRKIDFDHPDQHCWIHSQNFLEPYLKEIFAEVKFTRWVVGHEVIICKR